MNEKIEKRFKQAVSSASGDLHEWNKNWTPGCPNFDYEKVLYEKFAELIIQECCKEITQEPFNAGAASMWLKQHFGVEEQEKVPPSPKCSVCGTTENVRYVGGFQPYLCNSKDCIPF